MADNPLSIRVNEETKALFNELAEKAEFENKGDFITRLLTMYQSEQTKESSLVLRPAIEAVETLTSRLLEVLCGAGAVLITNEEKHRQELDQQSASFEETRTLLQQRIAEMDQELVKAEEDMQALTLSKEAAESKQDDFQQQLRQLENAIRDKAALIDEYKSKNDALSAIVAEYKSFSDENKELVQQVNKIKQENISLQSQLEELHREKERLKQSMMIENKAAMIEMRQELQAKMEEQQSRHAAAISDYENKVRELLSLDASVKAPQSEKEAKIDAEN